MVTNRILAAALILPLTFALGCRIETDHHGDSDNVKIATPFGDMSVKTNEAAVLEGTGLPPYPGAELIRKDPNNGAADVNMSFSGFHLRVKAVSYRTTDPTSQVAAFYRKALSRYGDVLQCAENDKPVGTPTRTAEGLTCEDHRDGNVNTGSGIANEIQLKAGSPGHQHIVAVETDGGGAKFGLIALDLPIHSRDHDDPSE